MRTTDDMKNKLKWFFVGFYFDGEQQNFLYFVADAHCDREAELKRVYLEEYGESLDDDDIRGVYHFEDAFDYVEHKTYKIVLAE